MVHNRRTALGILLLTVVFLFTGCASKQASTGTRQADTSTSKVQAAPKQTHPYAKPAKKSKAAEPLSSPLISSKFTRKKTDVVQEISVNHEDIKFVEQRLLAYEKKFQQWIEASGKITAREAASLDLPDDEDCVPQFERIMVGYSLLMERMLHNKTVPVDKYDTVDPTPMQQLDIAFLESRCAELLGHDTMFADDFLSETEEVLSFDQREEQITVHLEKEEYQQAIIAYLGLLQLFPNRKPDFTTLFQYSLALQHT